MAQAALARRYAQAAFEIASVHNQLDKWRKDLEAVAQGLKTPKLMDVLESPKVHLNDKVRLADLAMGDVLPAVRNLAHLLITRGRAGAFDQVVAEYGRLVDTQRGIEHAKVTTAVPLDAKDVTALTQRLKAILGKEVVVSSSVDPDIIGGLVVRVDDMLLDGSTRSQLSALRRALAERAV